MVVNIRVLWEGFRIVTNICCVTGDIFHYSEQGAPAVLWRTIVALQGRMLHGLRRVGMDWFEFVEIRIQFFVLWGE